MTRLLLTYSVLLAAVAGDVPQDPAKALEWQSRGYRRVAEYAALPPDEAIPQLGQFIRRLSMRNYNGEQKWPVIEEACRRLIEIPGHAQYYADALAEARKKTERPWVDSTYLSQYRMTRDILIHLPSPETIRVMGGMLESEEDIRSHEETVQIIRETQRTGGGNFNLTAPRKLAYIVLTKIGLRNCPETMEQFLEWWPRVKSGELAFSFVGQSVEYRFKPDGTVETTVMDNPPDDAPPPPEPRRQPETRTEPLGATSEPPSGRPFWPWIGAGLLIAALAGAWLAKKRSA